MAKNLQLALLSLLQMLKDDERKQNRNWQKGIIGATVGQVVPVQGNRFRIGPFIYGFDLRPPPMQRFCRAPRRELFINTAHTQMQLAATVARAPTAPLRWRPSIVWHFHLQIIIEESTKRERIKSSKLKSLSSRSSCHTKSSNRKMKKGQIITGRVLPRREHNKCAR